MAISQRLVDPNRQISVRTRYSWQGFYKAALLETDWTKMVELVQAAESEIHKRRLELFKDHNGTHEEREAVVNALNGLSVLRMDAAAWRERQKLFQLRDSLTTEIVPKGVLIMGISGCGKSLSIKAIASYFGLPLYRVVLGGQLCHFRLRRARRRTIGFQIDDQGLTVSAPKWVSLRAIEEAIVEKERWIRNKLAQWQDWRIRKTPKAQRFVDGAQLAYLGQELTLRLGAADERTAALRSGLHPAQELHLAMPPGADEAEVRLAVQTWYVKQAILILGRAQLRRREIFQLALKRAHRRAGGGDDDDRIILHLDLLS